MSPRNGSLDALRAAAILMVLACHVVNSFRPHTPLAAAASVGGRGVDLFFALSGWLLGSQLFREVKRTGTVDVRRFWARRWMRTLPAYYAVLAATFAQLVVQGRGRAIDWRYLVFLQNYLPDPPYLGVTWSLCVEEHFYLAVAPAILLAFRWRWGAAVVVGVVAVLLVLHALGVYYPKRPYGETFASQVRFEPCALGVLLAWCAEFRPRWWHVLARAAGPLAAVSLGLVLIGIVNRTWWDWWLPDWGTLGWGLILAAWVLLAVSSPFWRDRDPAAATRFVALRAYSLYLVHVEAIALANKLPLPAEGRMAVAVAVAFAAAEVLYRLVERPFIRLRERFGGSRAKPEAKAAEVAKVG